MKWLLIPLLILLKEAGPTAAHSCSCSSSWCYCENIGLSSVPQDLPTAINQLDLGNNVISTLNQSDFSRYSNLTNLRLVSNQISVINNGAFYSLSNLAELDINSNQLTSLRSDMFVGLDTLLDLYLDDNNIHSIEPGTFNSTPQLQHLYLHHNSISTIAAGAFADLPQLQTLSLSYNKITSLRTDMFVGLDTLLNLYLDDNNIHSIEPRTFNSTPQLRDLSLGSNNIHSIEPGIFKATPQLRELQLEHNNISTIAAGTFINLSRLELIFLYENRINTFPSDLLSILNIPRLSSLWLSSTQIETLPAMAYDTLASVLRVDIVINPWQCDCRMLPFKQRMKGSFPFESQIFCAGPANLTGKSLLRDVNPDDLGCEETTTTQQTTVTRSQTTGCGHSSQVLFAGFLGVAIAIVLTSIIFLAIWCTKKRVKTRPAPVPDPSDVSSNPNGAATGPTSGRHHTGQGASPSRAAHSDDGESRPGTSGTVPPPRSLDKSHAVLRAPLPPIKTAGPRGDVRNGPEAAHGDAAANISVPLSRHFIYQQTCPSGLPKGLPGL